MGKYMRKCRGVAGEVAVMEVSQVVGVRTRARTLALSSAATAAAAAVERAGSKRRKVAGAARVVQNSYLQLRSRSLVMTSRGTPANSGSARARCPSPAPDRLSRCSSNASSEVASVEDRQPRLRSGDPEVDDELETLPCHFERSRETRETTPLSELREESGDLESTAGKRKSRRSATEAATAAAVVMPPVAEIEEFFAVAERANTENLRFFGDKYNYDVANDVPLDGRYEWLRLQP
ncbi:cyclin-dependent kinase inhibitor 1-like [Phoenix dactylifera]|uniref:Cyclin-dependent kinase inhibitor 1-like n=1 Tax=Phoenix dactylifera TaxID=42345 RepID=A0A8B7CE73_PHODC|nr:cyclin-dependent kinase inhibitor 1-like [Phoenix dactylifera]